MNEAVIAFLRSRKKGRMAARPREIVSWFGRLCFDVVARLRLASFDWSEPGKLLRGPHFSIRLDLRFISLSHCAQNSNAMHSRTQLISLLIITSNREKTADMNAMENARHSKKSILRGADSADVPKDLTVRSALYQGIIFTSADKRTAFTNAKKMEGERHPLAKDPAWLAERSAQLQTLKEAVENHLSAAAPPSFTSADFLELGSDKTAPRPLASAVSRPWGAARGVGNVPPQQRPERNASGSAPGAGCKGPKRLVAKMGNIRFEERFEDQDSVSFNFSDDSADNDYI